MSKVQVIKQANGKRLIFKNTDDQYFGTAIWNDDDEFWFSEDADDVYFVTGDYDSASAGATADELRQIAAVMDKQTKEIEE